MFASREMPEYMGKKYNDEFQLMLNNVNIAKLPDGREVTINNLGTGQLPQTWYQVGKGP